MSDDERSSEPEFWSTTILAWGTLALFLLGAAFLSEGWLQPDEHSRVLEPAHHHVFGYSTLPWEFDPKSPMVSYLLGVIYAPLLAWANHLTDNSLIQAGFLRAFTALVCSTRLLALALLLRHLGLSYAKRSRYLILMGLGIFGPLLFLRTSQENWATTCLIWAISLIMTAVPIDSLQQSRLWQWSAQPSQIGPRSYRRFFLIGLLLALGTSFRLQLGVTAVSLGLLTVWTFGWRRPLACIILGGLCGLLPMAIVDWNTVGQPFLPAWNYLSYALSNEGGGQSWGVSPWYWYFKEYFLTWFPPLSIFILPLLLVGFSRRPIYALVFLPFLFEHLLLGHKEVRYFSPMVPLLFLAAFDGWEYCKKFVPKFMVPILGRQGWTTGWLWLNSSVGIGAALLPLNTAPRMYKALHDRQRAGEIPQTLTLVGNTNRSALQFYYRNPQTIPPLLTIREFFTQIENHEERGWYALYSINTNQLKDIETSCTNHFQSIPAWVRALYSLSPTIPARKPIHAIVFCPGPSTNHVSVSKKANETL